MIQSETAIIMRPYPARSGTQIQVPILSLPYFGGMDSIQSRHNQKLRGIHKSHSRGRVNTLKLEIPECRNISIPVVVFEKIGTTVAYSVLDGENEGISLLDKLKVGLTDGSTKQSNKKSTFWRFQSSADEHVVSAAAPLELKAKYRKWATTPEGEAVSEFDSLVNGSAATPPRIGVFDAFTDARTKGRAPRKYSQSRNRDNNMLAQQGYACAILPEATKGTALAWNDPTSTIDRVSMVEIEFQPDHLNPRCNDGSDEDDNRPMVCNFINQAKGSRLVLDENGELLPKEEIARRIRESMQLSQQWIASFSAYHAWLATKKRLEANHDNKLAQQARAGLLKRPWPVAG